MESTYRIEPGSPYPLGATWNGEGTNFAVFSAHATQIELCLFDASAMYEIQRIPLPEYTDQIWHGFVPGLAPGAPYGFRASGPYEPHNGHRFNPNKLLLDPYAVAMVGELQWSPALFGYEMESMDDLTFDTRDSAPFMPKCTVADKRYAWEEVKRPSIAWDETILYEAHVRGFTKLHPGVPQEQRGTYAGLSAKPVLDYLKSLGITSIELLPVHTFVREQHLIDAGLSNYWGYNTINFFAPAPQYAANPRDSLREFKNMIAALHEAGIEVILDVVYNHTAEGNERGPTLSYRGLDNATYYRLIDDNPRYYVNDTGTGNTFDLTHPRVLQMVMDSLRYWVNETQVDGFRFDLGTVMAREPAFNEQSGFLKVCTQDPVLSRVKLIAEPWDCGPGGYCVGQFPPGWAEWNDGFRDIVRDFWRGHTSAGPMAQALSASAPLFNHHGRRSWASVNFVTSHDGFTLRDVVSYNEKHNEANGDENRDGTDNNRSWNCGEEGPSENPDVWRLRVRQMRNLLATLLWSQGTPMLLAGDEFGRTQQGNNNAYCQDNEISWVNWDHGDEELCLLRFVCQIIALRKKYRVLRNSAFLTGESHSRSLSRDVVWIDANGDEMREEQWAAELRCFGMLLDSRAFDSRKEEHDVVLLIAFNAHYETVNFVLPQCAGVTKWSEVLSTAGCTPTHGRFAPGTSFALGERSMTLFEWQRKRRPSRARI